MGTNGLFLIAQLIHKNVNLGVRLLSNVSVCPRETRIRGGWAKLMLLAGQQQQRQEILDLLKGKGQTDTHYKCANVCMYVCMQINKPVFLKGKSSLLSMGDGRVYWQEGDVPPRGGELWSSDVWWEDLVSDGKYETTCFYVTEQYLCASSLNKIYIRVPEFLVMDHGVTDSIADWILCWFAQQKLLEFLLHFCTGHRTCETKRGKQQNWGDPWA